MRSYKKYFEVFLGMVGIICLYLFNYWQFVVLSESKTHQYLYQSREMRIYVLLLILLAIIVLIALITKIEFMVTFPFFNVSLNHSHGKKNESGRQKHSLTVFSHEFCVGCTGTVIGLIFSFVIISLYVVVGFSNYWIDLNQCWLIGFFGVLLAYSRYLWHFPATVRLIQHIWLPIGSAFFIVATDLTYYNTLSLILSFIAILILFWIRNVLSSIYHYHS